MKFLVAMKPKFSISSNFASKLAYLHQNYGILHHSRRARISCSDFSFPIFGKHSTIKNYDKLRSF